MTAADNQYLIAEGMRRIGFPAGMAPETLTTSNFDRLLEQVNLLKASAGPYRNVVICIDCSAVHDCPHDAKFENAFTHRKVCGNCGARSGFRDVVGRWVSFARTWSPSTWGKGCWVFDFCTSPGRNPDGTKRASE